MREQAGSGSVPVTISQATIERIHRYGSSLLGPRRSLVCLVGGDTDDESSGLTSDLTTVLRHTLPCAPAADGAALVTRFLIDQLEGLQAAFGVRARASVCVWNAVDDTLPSPPARRHTPHTERHDQSWCTEPASLPRRRGIRS